MENESTTSQACSASYFAGINASMNYQLEDLIDVNKFQEMLDSLFEAFAFPIALMDMESKVLSASGWQEICTKYHRVNPLAEDKCRKSDRYIFSRINEGNPSVTYRCPMGLIDSATPVIIDGKHLGNVFIGRFFLEEPDLDCFRKQAEEYGFDEEAYLKAVAKVPVLTKDQLERNLEFIRKFTEFLGETGLKRLKEVEAEETLKGLMEIMPVGVCRLDDDGNIEYANRHMVALFGYNLADIPTIGEWFSNAHPDPVCRDSYMASWNAWIAEAKANDSPIPPMEVKATCKDGTVKHVIVNTQVARNRVLIIFTDITEREYVQNELPKIQKLESLGVLAGEIAHDFKNILTVIIGNISFVRTFLLDASHTSQKPLEDAEEASRRAAELACRFLTFAKGGQAGQESRFSAPTHT